MIEKLRTVAEGIGSHTVNDKDIHVDDKWVLFTTNYDTVLEYFWTKIQELTLNTGFRKRIKNPDGFVFDHNSLLCGFQLFLIYSEDFIQKDWRVVSFLSVGLAPVTQLMHCLLNPTF